MRIDSSQFRFEPVFAEQLTRMGRADCSVAAAELVCGTILVTTPAYPFRLLRMERDLCHGEVIHLEIKNRAAGLGCL